MIACQILGSRFIASALSMYTSVWTYTDSPMWCEHKYTCVHNRQMHICTRVYTELSIGLDSCRTPSPPP